MFNVVFLGDIPSVCVSKKLLGSIVTVVNVFLSPNKRIACSLGSGITSSSKLVSLPAPKRRVVFPLLTLLVATNLFGACRSSNLDGTSDESYL